MNKKSRFRNHKNNIFKIVCASGIITAIALLATLIFSIIANSYQVFLQPVLEINYPYKTSDSKIIVSENLYQAINNSLKSYNISISQQNIKNIISLDAEREFFLKQKTGTIDIKASSSIGNFLKNPEYYTNHEQIELLNKLKIQNLIKLKFSLGILSQSDSREAESAGLIGGLIGSIMIILTCLACAIPMGVISAIYLEEFSIKGLTRNLIEININNLAAVPSIVYGLIGLFLLVVHLHLPRSSAIAAGITLGLLTLPTIIVCTRQAIRNIPKTIKQGALALGASPMQVTLHHILPLATPGIITGTVLSISRAIGETAPLIMLGMVAFIPDIPTSIFDPTSALPVLIYTWSDSPEFAFIEKVSAAILLLISIIISLNYFAIAIRNRYQKRW